MQGSSHHFNLSAGVNLFFNVTSFAYRLQFLILIFFMYSFIILFLFMLSTPPVNKSMKNWLLAAFVRLSIQKVMVFRSFVFPLDSTGKLFMIASKYIFVNIIGINFYSLRENSCIHISCFFYLNFHFSDLSSTHL